MPYILERHVLGNQQQRNQPRLSSIPRPTKQLHLNGHNNNGISHASKPTIDKLPLATPSKNQLNNRPCIRHEHSRPKIVPLESDPELAILELIPFGQQPVVNFGQIVLGNTRIMYIMLRNPLAKQQQLFVSSFPKPEKGFNMEATEFLIAPHTEICVALACKPRMTGGFRETITVRDIHRMSKKIILLGSVVRPKREPTLVTTTTWRTVPRIYNASPTRSSRIQNSERNNRLFSPKVTTQKTKKDVKTLTKLQFSSPQKRHQIVRAIIARRDLPMKQKAAVILQSHVRAIIARREFLKIRVATIFLQRHLKGLLARRRYQAQREAAITIQKNFRALRARREYESLKSSAVVLQKHIRGFIARREYQRKREAAILIQRKFKSWSARRKFVSLQLAAIVFQKHFRGLAARRDLEARREAAITIQREFRSQRARRHFVALRAAAIILQKHHRGLVARREYVAKKEAAICIQRGYKALCTRRRFLTLKSAAVVFQKCFRGRVARIEYQVKREAAIRIQRAYKSFCTRQQYLKLRSAAIVLQKHYRGLVARRERARLMNLLLSTIWLQSRVRGFLCRSRLKRSIQAIQSIQLRALRMQSYCNRINIVSV